MQEEVTQKTIALSMKTGKLTAQALQAALKKYLQHRAKGPKLHHGRQSLKQLKAHGASLTNIEVTEANIGAFKPCAKKYGVDFTLRKDKTTQPPHYIVIFKAKDELISALDEHLAELRQQREADLSAAQEAAFALDNGSTLFIQTCDSGYDYTLYGPDNKALDGGQLDAPGLTLKDAGVEALNLLGQTAAVTEVLLGDKLAAFQEAAEKANEIPAPIKIPDPAAEPTVTILWSESDKLQDGEIMPLSVANRAFEELDTAQHTDREKDGYTGGWYDKTAFRIDFTLNGQPDNYEGRQDFGDGEGSLVQHIQNYHEYYAKDENWKNFVLHNKGPEAWEQDKAEREMVLTEFIPYLKQHCNLSAMEQTAATALQEGQNISPEQAA